MEKKAKQFDRIVGEWKNLRLKAFSWILMEVEKGDS